MLVKVADNLKKVISPISRVLADIGVVMIVLVILVVVTDVTLRRFFSAPISGSRDLTILGFSVIVFLPMALCTMTDSQIQVDFLVSKFPKNAQRSLEVVMIFITTAILGLMSWEILMHGNKLYAMGAESGTLGIPMYPFVYIASFGSIMLTLAFLLRFLNSLIAITKERR